MKNTTNELAVEINNLAERLIRGEATFLDLLLATKRHVIEISGEPQNEMQPEVEQALKNLMHAALGALQREQTSMLTSTITGITKEIMQGKYGSKFFTTIRKSS